ncbi:MAG: tetratricopeptide repeat protein [Armatimonadota bacterium]|jgi:tetratricopeptide (TPR) repeat protein
MGKAASVRVGRVRAAAVSAALLLCALSAVGDDYAPRVADLRAAGQLPEAAALACEWASEEPGSVDALRACAELAFTVGRYAQAEEALRSLLFYAPTDPDVLVMLGEVLLGRGLFTQAREQFEAAVTLAPESGPAYAGLARATLRESDSPGDALAAAEVAVAIAPEHAPAHASLGAALRRVGRLDEALAALERACEIEPASAPAAFELGLTWSLLGEAERSSEAWARVIEHAPFSAEAWLLRNRLVIVELTEIIDRGFDAQYSPDGTRIAYRARGDGGWGIYVIPAEGEPVETRLWATESNLQSLAWSPDGSRIAALVTERAETEAAAQQWTRRLLLVPADGPGEPTLVLEENTLGEIAWNPASGNLGARMSVRRQGQTLVEIDPATGESRAIEGLAPRTPHYAPAWSPDGSLMLTARRSEQLPDGSFAYDLLVGPGGDFGSARIIHRCDQLPRGTVFTPDASAIIFARLDPESRLVSTWALPTDGSRDPVLIDQGAGPQTTPSLSDDGRYLLTARETMLVRATLAGLRED